MKRIRDWMYRNARPLDLAMYRYYFEDGGPEDVTRALKAYQNPDGGFAHALEADLWNPESSPIQTWAATEVLLKLGITNKDHPIVSGIIRYLKSGRDFDGDRWKATIPSNNRYPHAPWWTHGPSEKEDWGDNPTAALAAFLLICDPGDAFAREVLTGARERYLASAKTPGSDTFYCMRRMGQALPEDRALAARLTRDAFLCVGKETAAWATNYVCRPSDVLLSPDDPARAALMPYIEYEWQFLRDTRNEEGVWNITWDWRAYEKQFAVCENWWKGHLAVKNLRFLAMFGQTL